MKANAERPLVWTGRAFFMKRHRVRGFQHGTDVPARSAPLGIGSAIESKEKKLAPALRLTACNHLKR